MSNGYREITVKRETFRWKVGRKFIEIRGEDNKKILLERPSAQQRWGLITPHMDIDGLNIAIFTHEENCKRAFEEAKQTSSFKDQVEMVPLPPKTVSVTPTWIKEAILQHYE